MPTPTETTPPSGPSNDADETKLESFVEKCVNRQLLTYKVWGRVLIATAVGLAGFFRFKEWPDYRAAADSQMQQSIATQVKSEVGAARSSIEQAFSEHKDKLNGRFNDLDRRIETTVDQLNFKLGATEQKIQLQIQGLENMQTQYEKKFGDIIEQAQKRQTDMALEFDRLEKQKQNLAMMLSGLQDSQQLLTQNLSLVQGQLASLQQQQGQLTSHLSEAHATEDSLHQKQLQVEAMIGGLREKGDAVALMLGEHEFVLALKKLRNEVFRIQMIDARVLVTISDEAQKKLKEPALAGLLSRLQVNLKKAGEQRDCLEFSPRASPTLINQRGKDGELVHVYASSEEPYELFVPRVKGQPLSVLDSVDVVWLTTTGIPEEQHKEWAPDIDLFFRSVSDVTVQLYVNGLMVAEKKIPTPAFKVREEVEDSGEKRYSYLFDACDLGGCLKSAKEAYEQKLLAQN